MNEALFLFAELLIFLVGAFLYGFLARELHRNPMVAEGNRALRALAVSLAIWYVGSLIDEVGTVLIGATRWLTDVGPFLDVIRGLAWLLSFPLLVHALWRMLAEGIDRRRPGWYWLIPGYLTFALFLPTALSVLQQRLVALADVAQDVYPLFTFHVFLCSLAAMRMIFFALKATKSPDVVRFLRWLLGSVIAVMSLVVAGAFLLGAGPDALWAERAWRLSAEMAGLVLGLTFLYLVLRLNLFRMSVSFRSLRHFVYTLALVLLVMLAGPALGAEESELFRRFVAWGLLLALVAGVAYTPLLERALGRFIWLRRLLGKALTQEAMDQLTQRIHDLRLSEEEMMELTTKELGRLLMTDVGFLPKPSEPGANGSVARLWEHFGDENRQAFNRLDVPASDLASVLVLLDLHAVFPVRARGELKGVVSLGASATGAGYQEGEMEAVRLVLRQLGASLELRQLLEAQLANERRQAEQERLRMLGMVSASLAHELKNPLSSMKALAQTVREELAEDNPAGDQSRDMDLIVEQIDRMSDVAREILGFARVGHDTKADLASLVESSSYVLEHEARRRGITVDCSGVRDVGQVLGSSATWQTIVFNLILNALHHAPKGSTVGVRLQRDGERLCFETENAGPAIDDEIHQKLFEPFVTAGDSEEGTGLGLALVGRRVQELGGSVELINEPNHIVFRVSIDEARKSTPANEDPK